MRKILCILITLAFTSFTFAQSVEIKDSDNNILMKITDKGTIGDVSISGDLGIGISNPVTILDVQFSDGNITTVSNGLTITNKAGAIGNFVGMRLSTSGFGSHSKQFIGAIRTSMFGVGDIVFLNRNVSNSSTVTMADERMRITNNGDVGIGTTSPNGKLDVNGTIFQRGGVLHADYVFEDDYKLESIQEHSDFMWAEKHLPAIPKAQIDENGMEIVEIGSHRKGIVEELEKAHIYIAQLEERLSRIEQLIVNRE